MKRIIRLTESDLARIVKKSIVEMESSNEFTKHIGSPTKVSIIKFNKQMDYDGALSMLKKYGSTYRFPNNWDSIKDTFNSGEYWDSTTHGTYNISYYDMKDKQLNNGNRLNKKYLILVKKNK
jgi:hypothetical protein